MSDFFFFGGGGELYNCPTTLLNVTLNQGPTLKLDLYDINKQNRESTDTRDIQGEKSRKDKAYWGKRVSTIGA